MCNTYDGIEALRRLLDGKCVRMTHCTPGCYVKKVVDEFLWHYPGKCPTEKLNTRHLLSINWEDYCEPPKPFDWKHCNRGTKIVYLDIFRHVFLAPDIDGTGFYYLNGGDKDVISHQSIVNHDMTMWREV